MTQKMGCGTFLICARSWLRFCGWGWLCARLAKRQAKRQARAKPALQTLISIEVLHLGVAVSRVGKEAGRVKARLANANFRLGFAFGGCCAQGW